jgi:hypothetical protein
MAFLSVGGLLTSCGSSGSAAASYEKQTYLFNLNHIEYRNCDLFLIAGAHEYPLEKSTMKVFNEVAKNHPLLAMVGFANVSHQAVQIEMPKSRHQTCYIRKVDRNTGNRTVPFIFTHLPQTSQNALFSLTSPNGVMSVKYKRYGIDTSLLGSTSFDDNFIDTTDHACQLVSAFPEIRSQDPQSAATITNFIGTLDSAGDLSDILQSQGDSWATSKPLTNPDKTDPNYGKPILDNKGNQVAVLQWSAGTAKYAGIAIRDANNSLKNNTAFGMNRTGVKDNDPKLRGKLWDYEEGTTYRNPTGGLGDTLLTESFSYTATALDQFRYNVEDISVDQNRNITFTINNSGSRYLTAGVSYKDPSGNLLTYDQIGSAFFTNPVFPDPKTVSYSSGQTGFRLNDIIGPELRIFAIPVESADADYTVPTPPAAETIVILAGGLGNNKDPFPDVSTGGKALTCVMCLAVPTICTAMDAAEAYEGIAEGFKEQPGFITLIIDALWDLMVAASYQDPDALKDLAVQVGEWLLTARFAVFMGWMSEYIGSAELFNAFPIIGEAAEAVAALADAAEIAESIYDIANSPAIYQTNVVVSHTVNLTVSHDPLDTSGFPATATNYLISIHLGNATPICTDTIPLPSTSVPAITQSFNNVPVGGTLSVIISFYGADGCLVGYGTQSVDNSSVADLNIAFAIKEILHPLTSQTTYQHDTKIVLDANGNHILQKPSTPPTETAPSGCNNAVGQLCQYGDITVSNTYAGVGYAWRGYKGEMQWQFANVSVGDNGNPQSGYIDSFGSLAKLSIAYSLLGDNNSNYYIDGNGHARQIRLQLNGATTYDTPTSNRSWGKLRFSQDDIILHPEGKLISINAALSKFEVLTLPSKPWSDTDALLSDVRGGEGTRPGLLKSPVACAITAKGELLMLEAANNRISSYDSNGNPVPTFGSGKYSFPLKDSGALYLDMAVEHKGFIYVLSSRQNVFRLDVYDPTGIWVFRTTGFNADKIAVSLWRVVYSMNYEVQRLPNGNYPPLAEPTISEWIPFGGCSGSLSACTSNTPVDKVRLKDIIGYLSRCIG